MKVICPIYHHNDFIATNIQHLQHMMYNNSVQTFLLIITTSYDKMHIHLVNFIQFEIAGIIRAITVDK